MSDGLKFLLALEVAAIIVIALAIRMRMRKRVAAKWAARELKRSRECLSAMRKAYLEYEDRAPHDPTKEFLRQHYNHAARRHNAVADAIDRKLRA
jgi:hypothetical protein